LLPGLLCKANTFVGYFVGRLEWSLRGSADYLLTMSCYPSFGLEEKETTTIVVKAGHISSTTSDTSSPSPHCEVENSREFTVDDLFKEAIVCLFTADCQASYDPYYGYPTSFGFAVVEFATSRAFEVKLAPK